MSTSSTALDDLARYQKLKCWISAFVGLLTSIALPVMSFAMSVTPAVVDMAVTGRDSRASIQVINDGNRPLPIDFQVFRIDLDARGEKFEKPAGDEFVIFPPQALIPPGATQVFRLQWVGQPDIKASQSYVISVNQEPVKIDKGISGVQIVFNFSVIVNVAPPGGVADIKQIRAEVGQDEKRVRRPALTVHNPGNMHAYLSEAKIELSGNNGWRRSLSAADLRNLIGLGLVQPGKQRRFLIPVDLPAGVTQVQATIDYKPKTAR